MHENHRERVKARFLANGLDSFEEHNKLELLLFYSIPRIDTNETAHRLINKFGSLAGVFDANIEELEAVKGIGHNTAIFIKLMPQLARAYYTSNVDMSARFDNVDKIGRMLINHYLGVTTETVLLTLLDNKFKIIDMIKVHEGSVNSAHVTPRSLIEPAVRRNAAMVVISHNHPGGIAVPSGADMASTANLITAFRVVGITLLEHILVAGNQYTALVRRAEGMLESPATADFYSNIEKSVFYADTKQPL